jgi:hypothetical protein
MARRRRADWIGLRLRNDAVAIHREGAVAAILAALLTLTTAHYGPRAVGGADEYGYVSQADLWLTGGLTIDQSFVRQVPWAYAERAFAPLGYHPHPNDRGTLVPTYSPGLPLLLAAAKLAAGQSAMFYVVPIAAGLLVLATFMIGRALGSPPAGLIAAWLVATSPTVLFMSMATMSDVPVAAAWAWAFVLVLGGSWRSAAAAGVVSSIAILIRPNLAPLAGVLALRYVLAARSIDRRRPSVRELAAFMIALAPGIAAVAVLNDRLHGSALTSGYGALAELFVVERVPTNLRLYLGWLVESHTPVALIGLVAVFAPVRRIRLPLQSVDVSIVIALLVAFVWAIYCAWMVFDAWWFTRFLLPSWPFVMLALGAIAVAMVERRPRVMRPVIVMVLLALGVYDVHFAAERYAFAARDSRRRFVAASRLVRAQTRDNSVILSKDYNGALRYYGGRMTVDYSWMPRGPSIDTAVAWFTSHGVATYLAIEDWELPEVRARFAGSQVLRALERPPVAIYERPGRMLLFDLADPRPAEARPVTASDADIGSHAAPPLPPPRLTIGDGPR